MVEEEDEEEEEAHCPGFKASATPCVEPLPVCSCSLCGLCSLYWKHRIVSPPSSAHENGRHTASLSPQTVGGAELAYSVAGWEELVGSQCFLDKGTGADERRVG